MIFAIKAVQMKVYCSSEEEIGLWLGNVEEKTLKESQER